MWFYHKFQHPDPDDLCAFLDIITLSDTIRGGSDPLLECTAVNIEIHDAALEARIQKQLQANRSGSRRGSLARLLRPGRTGSLALGEPGNINAKIRRGIEQLDGRRNPEDQLDAHLANLKSQPK